MIANVLTVIDADLGQPPHPEDILLYMFAEFNQVQAINRSGCCCHISSQRALRSLLLDNCPISLAVDGITLGVALYPS
jgi:hypothetical protein